MKVKVGDVELDVFDFEEKTVEEVKRGKKIQTRVISFQCDVDKEEERHRLKKELAKRPLKLTKEDGESILATSTFSESYSRDEYGARIGSFHFNVKMEEYHPEIVIEELTEEMERKIPITVEDKAMIWTIAKLLREKGVFTEEEFDYRLDEMTKVIREAIKESIKKYIESKIQKLEG